jgi:hypothetical protein
MVKISLEKSFNEYILIKFINDKSDTMIIFNF